MPDYRAIKFDPEKTRCAFVAVDRCQLRGSLGHAAADGGWWLCAFHDTVVNLGEPNTLASLTEFLADQKAYGCTRWNHRTIEAWWDLTLGKQGLGCWDWRRKEEKVTIVAASDGEGGYE